MIRLSLMALAAIGLATWALSRLPWRDRAARGRALWLLLLPLPALLLVVLGPLGLVRGPYAPGLKALLLGAQNAGVGVTVVLALALLAWLSRWRASVLILGGLAVLAALVVAGVNEIIIDPRS